MNNYGWTSRKEEKNKLVSLIRNWHIYKGNIMLNDFRKGEENDRKIS